MFKFKCYNLSSLKFLILKIKNNNNKQYEVGFRKERRLKNKIAILLVLQILVSTRSFARVVPFRFLSYSVETVPKKLVLKPKPNHIKNLTLKIQFCKIERKKIEPLTYGVKIFNQRGGLLSDRVYWKQKDIPSSSTSHKVIVFHANSTTCDSNVPSCLAACNLNEPAPTAATT